MLHRVLPFRAISSFWPAAGFVDTEIGCFMKPEVGAEFVTDALIMAVWRRGKPDALLHHSDQGSLYTSEQFPHLDGRPWRRRLLDEPIRQRHWQEGHRAARIPIQRLLRGCGRCGLTESGC